jgi:hypothetical protein
MRRDEESENKKTGFSARFLRFILRLSARWHFLFDRYLFAALLTIPMNPRLTARAMIPISAYIMMSSFLSFRTFDLSFFIPAGSLFPYSFAALLTIPMNPRLAARAMIPISAYIMMFSFLSVRTFDFI